MKKITLLIAAFLSFSIVMIGQYYEPSGRGGALTDGDILKCSSQALYGQEPLSPASWRSPISDVSNPFNGEYFARYDNFTITEGSICYLKFWGMPWMWDEFWYGCDENPMTFRIRFFEDIGLDIGNLVLSFDVELTGTPTGVFYFETGDDQYVELLEYKVNLPQKVNLKNGWVSVMGISVKSPQDCGFGWMGSPYGDAYSLREWPEGNFVYFEYDFSYCLGCSNPIPLSNWALGIGLFLIIAATFIRMRRFV